MKLIVQSDDYGITPGCARGIVDGIRNGLISQTGFFTNMPWAEEVFQWIKPYLGQIAFGIDLNASTGVSLLGYDKVPGLCHEDGSFLTSRENRALDTEENNFDHVNYDEVYAEFDAQIQKFIELVGKKPDYIHGHAYGTATTFRATTDLARKYGCVLTTGVNELPYITPVPMGWVVLKGGVDGQLTSDMFSFIKSHEDELLKAEVLYLIGHMGYCDAEIFRLSSFNVVRAKDLDAVTSDEMKNWVKENNIEVISFNDLPQLINDIDLDSVTPFTM